MVEKEIVSITETLAKHFGWEVTIAILSIFCLGYVASKFVKYITEKDDKHNATIKSQFDMLYERDKTAMENNSKLADALKDIKTAMEINQIKNEAVRSMSDMPGHK